MDLPASDPLTLAVGGTSLEAAGRPGLHRRDRVEHPSRLGGAGGGGFSQLFPRPAYQDGVAGIGATRGVPDVAADARPSTGMAHRLQRRQPGYASSGPAGPALPLRCGPLIALADQYAGRDLGFVNPALYRIGRSSLLPPGVPRRHHGHQHRDVPSQTITGYQAGPGWDPVTGWGSPNAQVLVPLLARYVSP